MCEIKRAMHGLVRCTSLLVAMAAYLHGPQAYAADSIITVKGEVYAEPCTVASSSANLVMDFGRISAKGLQAAKSASGWTSNEVTIALTSCPAGTKTAKARFDGAADPSNATIFKSTGTAANVGVWLAISGDGSAVTPGSTRTTAIANGAGSFKVGGKLYTEKGGVTAGTVNATIAVTISYE